MAYSENNPLIIFEVSGAGGVWSGVERYYDFIIADAGIRKISQATIRLHNEDGRFTDSTRGGYLGLFRELRIRSDVGVWSGTLFQGNIFGFDPDEYIQGEATPRSILTVVARDKYGQRCLRETITHPYYDNGWTASGALVDMLADPDSGDDTDITLDLDNNSRFISGVFPTNPSQSDILSAVQDACEEYGYDGFFEYNGVLYLRSYRVPRVTVSGASPAIHYILSSGLTVCEPRLDIEDVKNYIFVHGGGDAGYPPVDYWTENPITQLSGAWTAICGVLSEDDVVFQGENNSLRTTTTAINTDPWCSLDIYDTGYIRPQIPACGTMDFTDDRFASVDFSFRYSYVGDDVAVRLVDSNGDAVQNLWFGGIGFFLANTWYTQSVSVRVADQGLPTWTFVVPSSGFAWDSVRRVEVLGSNAALVASFMNVDLLHFTGVGWDIDPFTYTGYGSPQYDTASIGLYGRTVYHHSNDRIICFEQAYAEALRVLEENKDPFQRIKISKGAKVWAKPSETVQVTISPWNISNETYRILEREIRYNAEEKLLRTTHDLVALDAEVASSTVRREKTWGSLVLQD